MLKVSLITVTLNNANVLKSAMASVFTQTYQNIEYLVIDGASTDGTLEILKNAAEKIDRYVSEPDKGLYHAMNKGISLATGDIVGFLHADDQLSSPAVIEKVASIFQNQDADVVYGDLVYVDKNNPKKIVRNWKSCPFQQQLLRKGWMPPHPAFYVRKALYERHGVFNTTYRIAADYDLMTRFLSIPGIKAAYLPEVLVSMQTGGISNRGLKNILLKMKEDLQIMRKHKTGGLITLIRKNLSKIPQLY